MHPSLALVRLIALLVALPAHAPPAPWLEAPAPRSLGHPLDPPVELADGERHGLVATNDGREVFLVSDDTIVPLALPAGWRWAGLGEADAVLVAQDDGTLARLEDQGRTTMLEKLPRTLDQDAAVRTIALTDGDVVVISLDGGKSFRTSRPGKRIKRVRARPDGVVVAAALDEKETWITADGGATWLDSPFRPGRLERIGSVIWNGDETCAAALDSAGKGWVHVRWFDQRTGVPWTDSMSPTEQPNEPSGQRHPSPIFPAAPPPDPTRRAAREGDCNLLGAELIGNAIGSAEGGPGCGGTGCLRGTVDRVSHPGRTEAGFLANRAGTVAVVDRAQHPQVSLRPRPPRCEPLSIRTVGGLVLLLCKGDRAHAFTTTRGDPAWHDEGELAARPEELFALTQAADGSIVYHLRCKKTPTCRALARSPVAAGAPDAWRAVSVPDAVVYRAAERGAVVAVAGDDLSLYVDEGGKVRPLLEHAVAPGDLRALSVDADGRVVIDWSAGKRSQRSYLGEDGKPTPAPPRKIERSKEGYEIVEPVPIEP